MTAEETLNKMVDTEYVLSRNGKDQVIKAMIAFAQEKVEDALQAAADTDYVLDSDRARKEILNCYSKHSIK